MPASFLIQLSIGSVYAISMFTGPLTRNQGIVVSAATDWSFPEVAQILSIMAITLGTE